jgi:aspartate aminotransferase-like enzyme
VKVVYATYSDTSTGTLYDIKGFAGVTKKRGVRLVVDAITGVGVHELKQDEWGVDVVVCGSQKGLMVPPGLATISIAPFAKEIIDGPKLPRFYFDLQKLRRDAPRGETPWTPAVSLILALEEALDMISEEGIDNVVDRHMRLAKATQAGGQACGYQLYSSAPAHSCTAFRPPQGMDADEIVTRMQEVHRMIVAGGQGELKGEILRVGHMGEYDLHDIVAVVSAMEDCVTSMGGEPGGAARAARQAWIEA